MRSKTFRFGQLPAEGLHAPDEKHELLVGHTASTSTSIKLTDEELTALEQALRSYRAARVGAAADRAAAQLRERGYRRAAS
jgi:hypothetical protein